MYNNTQCSRAAPAGKTKSPHICTGQLPQVCASRAHIQAALPAAKLIVNILCFAGCAQSSHRGPYQLANRCFWIRPVTGSTGYSDKPLVVLGSKHARLPCFCALLLHAVTSLFPPYKDTHKTRPRHNTPRAFHTFFPLPHGRAMSSPPPLRHKLLISFGPAISFRRLPPPRAHQRRPPQHPRPA